MDTSIAGLDDLVEEMLSERPSLTNFLNHSFGVCLLAGHPGGERRLAGWCLSEYNSDDRCEVGIAVVEEYRRRGLATLMGRAFLAEAWRRGVSDVGWICWTDNLPSLKTAEKLGFRLVEERDVYIGLLDEQIHLAAQGNRAFGDGRYATAADWYAQALALENGPAWLHWNAACAHARLDRPEEAFTQLEQAAAAGFRDIAHITASPHLTALHHSPRWNAFLTRLEQPAPAP
jgi:GNAT superfamily N-acetyltransferase